MARPGQKLAGQLVHAPMMITLPSAYLTAKYVLVQTLGASVTFAALLTALMIYGFDRYSDEENWDLWDYGFRLLYAIVSTAVLMAVFAGDVNVKV